MFMPPSAWACADVPDCVCLLAHLFSEAYSNEVATAELQQALVQDESFWMFLCLGFFAVTQFSEVQINLN